MKKFNEFMEAVLIAKVIPSSDTDALAPVEQCGCDKEPQDKFGSATDDFMKELGFDGEAGVDDQEGVMQPDDDVGEAGEIEGEASTSNVELTCMGEEGLQVKVNGLTFVLPIDVVDAIKGFESSDDVQGEMDEESQNEEPEESESTEEETAEQAEGGSEETETEETDEEDGKKNPFTEAKKKGKAVNPWAVCNASTGGKKKAGVDKFESCVMGVKGKNKIKK